MLAIAPEVESSKVEDILKKMEVGFEIRRVDLNKSKAKYLLLKGEEDAARKSLLSAAEMIRAGELANIGNDLCRKFLEIGARRLAESDLGREVKIAYCARVAICAWQFQFGFLLFLCILGFQSEAFY